MSNIKHFKEVVRSFNETYGFDLALPDDTNYESNYAHPQQEIGDFTLTSQIDSDSDYPYALRMSSESASFYLPGGLAKADLVALMGTQAFKHRLQSLKVLVDIRDKLDSLILHKSDSVLSESISEVEREEQYEIITRTARALYKDSSQS